MSLLLAIALLAPSQTKPDPAPTPAAKLRCRQIASSGSRFTTKMCRTEAEWKAQMIDRDRLRRFDEAVARKGTN